MSVDHSDSTILRLIGTNTSFRAVQNQISTISESFEPLLKLKSWCGPKTSGVSLELLPAIRDEEFCDRLVAAVDHHRDENLVVPETLLVLR